MEYKFKKIDNEDKIKLKGKCYVGDPCYVLDDNKDDNNFWDKFVNFLFKDFNNGYNGIIEILGHKIIISSTCYGDGSYNAEFFSKDDDVVKKLFVDSGSLSIIPLELIKLINPNYTIENTTDGIMVIDLDDEFSIELENGNIELEGNNCSIRIITDGSDIDEDEDEY